MNQQKKLRIIIVDDDEFITNELQKILQYEQYEVITAKNPKDADSLITNFQPNLMLLDLNMPGYENGKYYCKRIYSSHHIPIMIITASQDAAIPAT